MQESKHLIEIDQIDKTRADDIAGCIRDKKNYEIKKKRNKKVNFRDGSRQKHLILDDDNNKLLLC